MALLVSFHLSRFSIKMYNLYMIYKLIKNVKFKIGLVTYPLQSPLSLLFTPLSIHEDSPKEKLNLVINKAILI